MSSHDDTVAGGTLWVPCVGETSLSHEQRSRVDAKGQKGGLWHLPFVCSSRTPYPPPDIASGPGGWSVWSTSCVLSVLVEPHRRSEREREELRSGYLFPLCELAVFRNQWPRLLSPWPWGTALSLWTPAAIPPNLPSSLDGNTWLLLNLGYCPILVVPQHPCLFL